MENNRCYGCMEQKQNHPICEHCGFDERKQNDVHQLPMGSILRGQYLIGKVLGQGGFGITYLGWDLYLDKAVAIKEFYPGSIVTRDAAQSMRVTSYTEGADLYDMNKERFMREAKTLAKFEDLQHIVKIHSFFPENNTVYLVMEYAKGHTLQQQLKKQGPMSLAVILEILKPVMADLQKVHEGGIIHRDISPDNIMLLEKGGAKLLDFGAVRQVENPDQEAQLSKSTEAILKQGFAPIEQYNSRGALGPWTDVYAMCATICYCLNGRLPQIAPDRAYDEAPDHFIDILPITEDQKAVLRRGMAVRPKDRIASMAELLGQLQASLADKPKEPVSQPRQPEPAPGAARQPEPSPGAARQPEPSPGAARKPEPEEPIPPKPISPKPAPEKKKPLWLIPVGIGAVCLILALVFLLPRREKDETPGTAFVQETIPEVPEATVCNPGDQVLRNFSPYGASDVAFGTDILKEQVVSIRFLDSLETAPADAVDVSETQKGKVLLWSQPAEDDRVKLFIAGAGRVYFPRNSRYLFKGMKHLDQIVFSGVVNTENVTDMNSMFSGCSGLTSLDVSSFDTGNVTNMHMMFVQCSSLTSLDLSGFNTGNVKDMGLMFMSCSSLTSLDVSSFETGNVTDMNRMFSGCSGLTSLDVSSFETENVTDMNSMFSGCSGLTSLDVSSFETGNVTDMKAMFWSCGGLTEAGLKTNDPKLKQQLREDRS